MTIADPLILRCLALTGSFETSKLPPGCFSSLAGDFDGQGLSFSALQWNIGEGTLQPLLSKMFVQYPAVMEQCFGAVYASLHTVLSEALHQQLLWARAIQQPHNNLIDSNWSAEFAALGATPEWQAIAQDSAAGYFDHAKFQASRFGLRSDRALALLFDCAVQNGGISSLAMHHVLDSKQPTWGEPEMMRAIAEAVADGSNPKYRKDVLDRKSTIANGIGLVHGLRYDLEKDFSL